MSNAYLRWLSSETPSAFWQDSAVPAEAEAACAEGAEGMTTNPFLANAALKADPEAWRPLLAGISADLKGQARGEEVMRRMCVFLAEKMRPIYDASSGSHGYVCAQTNPNKPCDYDTMMAQARRYAAWAPNICVKLPCTAMGVRAYEDCAAEGINVVGTVSFTVPQCLALGEAFQRGAERARKAGLKAGLGVAVLMVGRLDDYLRDVVRDSEADVPEGDIIQAGTACIKRAYRIFKARGYEAVLMPAGCRGAYHITELAGAGMIMSIGPKVADMLQAETPPFATRIDNDVDEATIARLKTLPEFIKAYEPDGMAHGEFITYGPVNRTLTQFIESGWNPMEALRL